MIGGGKVLGLIPARGGSKGIPRKNLRPLAGKPLLAWTVEEAQRSRYLDRLVVSSEDEEIIAAAEALGCEAPFRRPAELADDKATGMATALHALQALPGFDYLVYLQPTSPLRRAEDIDGCLETCLREGAASCVTVVKAAHSPYWLYTLGPGGRMAPFLTGAEKAPRRQDAPELYLLNGAVYVASTDWMAASGVFVDGGTLAYEMPAERSLDIDRPEDLELAEWYMDRRRREQRKSGEGN